MIFFFSGTGNTEWAAKTIADALDDVLVSIPEALKGDCHYRLQADERIGFCFPVHGWRTPKIVRQFIKRLHLTPHGDNPPFTYAVCTAGDTIGETMDLLRQELSERNLPLCSAYSLLMPESYVGLPFMDVDTKEKELSKKETAARQLAEIIPQLRGRQQGIFRLVRGRWPKTNSRMLGAFFENVLITDSPFRVVSSRCVKCGICADVCPVADIRGGLGLEPEWKHEGSCLSCFACYHHCPHHAIEYGGRTRHKGQYFYNRHQR
ncbi:MAG: EFR1 family ferrodoxin [Prevotella sp.]|nr:EFR1 family ferrodoxin [Prevotella sp.]